MTYDSSKDNMFMVHKPDMVVCFKESSHGLFYHDTTNREIALLNSVEENAMKYSCCDNNSYIVISMVIMVLVIHI